MENLDLDTQPTSVCVALAYGLGNYASTGPRKGVPSAVRANEDEPVEE